MLTPEDFRHSHDVRVLLRAIANLPPGADALRREDALVLLDVLLGHLHAAGSGPGGQAGFAPPAPRRLSCCGQ